MRAIKMVHKEDPIAEIAEKLALILPGITMLGADVLLAIYVRPTITAGGIHLADATRNEDVYQGKVGLVLKMGPIAFEDDDNHRFGGVKPKEGDWVAVRVGDTFQLSLGDWPCRIAEDINIRAILTDPDSII